MPLQGHNKCVVVGNIAYQIISTAKNIRYSAL